MALDNLLNALKKYIAMCKQISSGQQNMGQMGNQMTQMGQMSQMGQMGQMTHGSMMMSAQQPMQRGPPIYAPSTMMAGGSLKGAGKRTMVMMGAQQQQQQQQQPIMRMSNRHRAD